MIPKICRYALITLLLLPVAAAAEPLLPVEGGVITSRVGWRLDPFGSGRQLFHRGIDIAVPLGTPVKAVRPGRVVLAGPHGAYGTAVVLEHSDGSRTLYGHNALVRVQQGETVGAGAVIALSGNSGRSTGPHVHFEEQPATGPLREPPLAVVEQETPQTAAAAERLQHEQRLDAAISSVLRRINRLPEQPAGNGQGGGQEAP